jgi:hypothetical protein
VLILQQLWQVLPPQMRDAFAAEFLLLLLL